MQAMKASSLERAAIIQWTARMGAVTATAVADRQRLSVTSARAQLVAAAREGLLRRSRPLTGQPALYGITSAGLGAAGLRELGRCTVSASNARHLAVCAEVAAALESSYPDQRLLGERELRWEERDRGFPLASACSRGGSRGDGTMHSPDLVLWPTGASSGLPVAVEVELTVKSPQRLTDICLAWARCRHVAGAIYMAAPEVERPLARAIEKAGAGDRIVVLPLDSLRRPRLGRSPVRSPL
jgi:hypothetical protein